MHRRRHSIGDEAKKWRTQILQRINVNAKRKEDDLQLLGKSHPPQRQSNSARPPQPIPPPSSVPIIARSHQMNTPPTLISSRPIRATPRPQPFTPLVSHSSNSSSARPHHPTSTPFRTITPSSSFQSLPRRQMRPVMSAYDDVNYDDDETRPSQFFDFND